MDFDPISHRSKWAGPFWSQIYEKSHECDHVVVIQREKGFYKYDGFEVLGLKSKSNGGKYGDTAWIEKRPWGIGVIFRIYSWYW